MMACKCNLDEYAVIKRYEECETAQIVAKEFGVSTETIYRILERNNIPRTHRHPKKPKSERVSNCNSKYCPSLIVMLRTVLDMNNSDIAGLMGCHKNAVSNVIVRYGLQREKPIRREDVDLDAIEREYLGGASTYELENKYKVDRRTIGKWMKELGHVRGKGYKSEKAIEKTRQALKGSINKKVKQEFLEWFNSKFQGEYICVKYGGMRKKSKIHCCTCGSDFLWTTTKKYNSIRCPVCYQREIEEHKAQAEERKEQVKAEYEKEKTCQICGCVFHSKRKSAKYCSDKCKTKAAINKKLDRDRRKTAQKRAIELKKDKVCQGCGSVFHSEFENKIYCDECASKASYCDHKWRAKRNGVEYESGITLEKLIKRDRNTCQICGMPCDKTDKRWGSFGPLYPSIDHIVAMSNGGGHTWDNIQLAHCICNSYKRNLTEEELTEEVITHAKEQAIAYKCA